MIIYRLWTKTLDGTDTIQLTDNEIKFYENAIGRPMSEWERFDWEEVWYMIDDNGLDFDTEYNDELDYSPYDFGAC